MENNSKLSQILSQISDKISEQAWLQQIKSKWDELDPRARLYTGLGLAVGSVVLTLAFLLTSFLNVRAQKKELAEKQDLVQLIQTANDEMRVIRASGAGRFSGKSEGDSAPWNPYFESTADAAGIAKENVAVGAEKVAPAATGATASFKESLIDVNLKKVNIKQVVRYAVGLENGSRPVKLRNLTIDTQPDLSGYLDATLAVSAFSEKK
ncbi:MAG: hypothetical protein H7222_11920 [Methylotenera sp.]|nr:hypothetical protein [Oligoflexia bacterium]